MDPSEYPVTAENAEVFYEWMFAPWVRAQGHTIVTVEPDHVVTRLPQDPTQAFAWGHLCGQSLMSAIDTASALAVFTAEPYPTGGTASQNTRFLRAAKDGDMLVDVRVVKRGRRATYLEAHVRSEVTGDLVAHATVEFI